MSETISMASWELPAYTVVLRNIHCATANNFRIGTLRPQMVESVQNKDKSNERKFKLDLENGVWLNFEFLNSTTFLILQ